ncbi:helix-turn-helix domain-containing protein [Bizionia paragorgiae]|uniref:helix-turn-helix domain-containing protein n=1 Tax=Bizionia paragorgiae TaxID=283786 RepID=UPI003A91C490
MSKFTEENIIFANKIADRVKSLRIKYGGKRQSDFVKKYNVEKQEISRWESHVKRNEKTGNITGRGITIYTINKFCNLINISLKEFFDDDLFRK